MSPATIALIIQLVQLAIQEYPAFQADLTALLNKNNPTADDWAALLTSVQGESYKQFVPSTDLKS